MRLTLRRVQPAVVAVASKGLAFVASTFAGLAFVAACGTSTPALPYTPFTGIRVSSTDLFTGHACGTGPNDVYEYVAVVSYLNDSGVPMQLAATVYGCTADAVFQNLTGSANSSYGVTIYAFASAASGGLGCDGGACPVMVPVPVDFAANATWTAQCVAVQESGDNTLAQCSPLQPTAASGSLDGG